MLDLIQSDCLRKIYAYWEAKRGDRLMPSRDDIDPSEIKPHLPFVFLIQVQEGQKRLLYRLSGTGLATRFGEEQTGRYLEDLDLGDVKDEAISSFYEVVSGCRPTHLAGEYRKADGRLIRFERVAMPLSSDQTKVQMIFGANDYIPLDGLNIVR